MGLKPRGAFRVAKEPCMKVESHQGYAGGHLQATAEMFTVRKIAKDTALVGAPGTRYRRASRRTSGQLTEARGTQKSTPRFGA